MGDWEVYKANGTESAVIDTASPIVGTGALLMRLTQSGDAVQLRPAAHKPRAFLKGRARTLVHPVSAATNLRAGIYCMASAGNIATAGSAYALPFKYGDTLRLEFIDTPGLDQTSQTVLATTAYTFTQGQTYALELEWAYDLAAWGGVRLVARVGTRLDFSDLAEVLAHTHGANVLAASFGEGLFAHSDGGAKDVVFDETTIFEVL
jgi:hypothetical protein